MRHQKPCLRCGKIFYHLGSLKSHLNRKKQCESKYLDLTPGIIISNYYEYLDKYYDDCKPKLKLKNDDCKLKLKLINEKPNNLFKITSNKSEIKTQNINGKNIVSDNGKFIDNSKNLNNNIYITVNSFGNENTSHLSRADWNNIINKNLDAIPELTKKIHIEDESNHNIIINSVKDGHGKKFNGNDLVLVPIRELLEDIVSQTADRLYDYIETNQISKNKHVKMTEVLEKLGEENSSLLKKNAKDVKYMIVNAKTQIKKTLRPYIL
jgi:hypothetical protein